MGIITETQKNTTNAVEKFTTYQEKLLNWIETIRKLGVKIDVQNRDDFQRLQFTFTARISIEVDGEKYTSNQFNGRYETVNAALKNTCRIEIDRTVFIINGQSFLLPPLCDDIAGFIRFALDPKKAERESRKYISTGIPALDVLLGGGIRVGELTIIAGTKSIGKSCLLSQIFLNDSAFSPNLFSCSETKTTLLERILKQKPIADVYDYVSTLSDVSRIERITKTEIESDFFERMVPETIKKGSLLVIDSGEYIGDRYRKLTSHFAITKGFQEFSLLAQTYEIGIVVSLPLNSPSPFDKPTFASVSPRQATNNAYQVIGLWRDEEELLISLLSNRNGRLGDIRAKFNRESLLFEAELTEEQQEEIDEKQQKDILKQMLEAKKNGTFKTLLQKKGNSKK